MPAQNNIREGRVQDEVRFEWGQEKKPWPPFYNTIDTMSLPPLVAPLLPILHTTLYVGVLYLSPHTRPRKPAYEGEPNRLDDPIVKQHRIRAVTWATLLSTVLTSVIIRTYADPGWTWFETLGVMGLVPASKRKGMGVGLRDLNEWLWETARAVGLVVVLFSGSVWEKVVVGEGWRWEEVKREWEGLCRSIVGWRNLVVGPVTEELVFRACMVPLHVLAGRSPIVIVFTTPLYFGIAHIHHLYEFLLRQPRRLIPGILRTIFQFSYTTLFGWIATFIYLRTGSVWTVVIVHSFCNYMGVPNFGRVSQTYSWLGWGRWVDYVGWGLHLAGLCGFWGLRWRWTEGQGRLVEF